MAPLQDGVHVTVSLSKHRNKFGEDLHILFMANCNQLQKAAHSHGNTAWSPVMKLVRPVRIVTDH